MKLSSERGASLTEKLRTKQDPRSLWWGPGPDTCVAMATEMQGWGLHQALPPCPIVRLQQAATTTV